MQRLWNHVCETFVKSILQMWVGIYKLQAAERSEAAW